jgi:zinc metalloprotease ZmpA
MLAGRVTLVLAFMLAASASAATLPPVGRGAAAERALKLALANRGATRLSPAETLEARNVVVDANGDEHVRFQRRYASLRVIGGDLLVHSRGDRLRSTSTSLRATLKLSIRPRLDASEAIVIAGTEFGLGFSAPPSAELVVYARGGRAPRLVWQVGFQGVSPYGNYADMSYLVDAMNGAILDRWSNVHAAKGGRPTAGNGGTSCLAVDPALGLGRTLYAGTVDLPTVSCGGSYELRDATRGIRTHDMRGATSGDGQPFVDGDNAWGRGQTTDRQSAGADAHYGLVTATDYFAKVHGRAGWDGQGSGVLAKVHFGTGYNNAFWLEGCNCIGMGDGDGKTWGPLVNLDTAAHELSHGVTSSSAGLIYSGESGALNEASSDIFGTLVEFYAGNPNDAPDYMIGEQFFLKNVPGSATQKALRYMWNPARDGGSPACYNSNIGLLDVHMGSGVANHFFYLLAEGSGAKTFNGVDHSSPTCNGASLTGIGRDKAARIWFRALTVYMASDTDYRGARAATVAAANDLFGTGSVEAAAVVASWGAVNVY